MIERSRVFGVARMLRLLPAIALLPACVSLPPARTALCEAAKRPVVTVSEDDATASTTIDVLTYNVEGLPNSLRFGRPAALKEIGERLAALRQAGEAPDIVMFQEVFSRSARGAVLASGYPSITPGPSARDRVPRPRDAALPGRPNPRRGEIGLKVASSGIVIASEFPVVADARQPFARNSCAGLDCLSNKGLAFARVRLPGVPGSIDLFNTHMNSTRASRVPQRRHLAAHRKQSRELMGFLGVHGDPAVPTIFGGDFNMRGSSERFAEFARWKPLTLVHRYCVEQPEACDVRMSWDGDQPWLDTQDLQLFRPGEGMGLRPIRVEAMFDDGPSGPRLSDHDGLRVRYELSWPARLTPASPCGPPVSKD
jgi:endonuclease/exonuclease/phosphatase family metal-dependent hydrolase